MKLFNIKNIQFQNIMSDIRDYLSRTIGATVNINQSSVFGQLITIISGVAHNIMLYIEDSLIEQNKYTAQRKKSILGLAAQSGYQPSYGRASGVWIRISHKPNNGKNLDCILPDKSRFICSQNGLYYVLDLGSPAVVLKCATGIENTYYYAVQGRYESQRFVADGGQFAVQNFKYIGYLDVNYLQVHVNGELWEYKDSIYDMTPGDKQYTVRYNPVNGCDILFGTDKHGKRLNNGDIIEIKYLLHDGESGNVTIDDNTYFIFADPIKNVNGDEVDGNAVFECRFATKDAVSAGSNAESATQIRNMIGFNSRSLVLADPHNYQAFLNRFSFVGYNRSWSEPGSMTINSLIMRNYKLAMDRGKSYFDLVDNDFVLSDIQKDSLKNALIKSGQQLAGTNYNIVDIELAKYALFIYVKLKKSSTDKNAVSIKIKNIIGAFFGDIQSDQYIPKSDIIHVIKSNVPEVDGVTCYFLSKENEDAINRGYYIDTDYTWDPTKGTYNVKKTKMKVYSGTNPNLGLDAHGNISLKSDQQFPVLAGGWTWKNKNGQEVAAEPITIVYE